MQKFTFIKGIPAHLPIVNIDTDMIIPKQFLKTIKRTGLGKNLFFELRYLITFLSSLITSGPIPSPGKSNIFLFFTLIIKYPGPLIFNFIFEGFYFIRFFKR